jgi:hypothetical protein
MFWMPVCSTSNTHSFNSCPVIVWLILLSQFLTTSKIFLSYCYSKYQTKVLFQDKLNYSSALQVIPFSLIMLLVTCRVGQWWATLLKLFGLSPECTIPTDLVYSLSWIIESHSDIVLIKRPLGSSDTVEGCSYLIPSSSASKHSFPSKLSCLLGTGPLHYIEVSTFRRVLRTLYSVISWLQITIFLPTYFPLHVFTM